MSQLRPGAGSPRGAPRRGASGLTGPPGEPPRSTALKAASPWTAAALAVFLLPAGCADDGQLDLVRQWLTRSGIPPTAVFRYESPKLALRDGALVITGSGKPAGLSIFYALEPEKTYRVTVSGQAVTGLSTLRLRRGESMPSYAAAPQGSVSFSFKGAPEIEFLFYGDQEFTYRLHEIQIAECGSCKTDDALRAQLVAEIPGLERALAEDRLTAARLLLDWAANTLDWAQTAEIDRASSSAILLSSAASAYYEVYTRDAGGSFCGGAADFYDKVLKLFEFPSFIIHFGDQRAGLTHAVVLVPQKIGAVWRFHVFDPTFNLSYRKRDTGAYATFRELAVPPVDGSALDIAVEAESLDERDFLTSKNQPQLCPVLEHETDRHLICSWPAYGLGTYLDLVEPSLRRLGYSTGLPGLRELMGTKVFWVGASLDPEARLSFLEQLRSSGIPYGG